MQHFTDLPLTKVAMREGGHRNSVRSSHPDALGLIFSIPEIYYLNLFLILPRFNDGAA